MKRIMLLLILTSQILAEWGPEGYVPDNSINWDQLVPLFRALIAVGLVVGFPIIVTVVIYSVVQILKYGLNWAFGLASDLTRKEKDGFDEEDECFPDHL